MSDSGPQLRLKFLTIFLIFLVGLSLLYFLFKHRFRSISFIFPLGLLPNISFWTEEIALSLVNETTAAEHLA